MRYIVQQLLDRLIMATIKNYVQENLDPDDHEGIKRASEARTAIISERDRVLKEILELKKEE